MIRVFNALLSLSFLLSSYAISAQNQVAKPFRFSIYVAPNYSIASSKPQVSPAFSLVSVDSLETHVRIDEMDIFFDFEHKFGASLGGNIHYSLNKFIQIESGLGLQFSRYFGITRFGPIRPVSDPEIRIFSHEHTEQNPFICDEFIDVTRQEALDFQPGIHHNLLNLEIPLQITLQLFDGQFNIYAGGLFSTPVYTSVPFLDVSQIEEVRTDDSGQSRNVCTIELFINHDTDGVRFTNTNFGAFGGLRYQMGKRWGVDLHYQKMLNSITIEDYQLRDGAVRLSSFALKLRYFLSPNR